MTKQGTDPAIAMAATNSLGSNRVTRISKIQWFRLAQFPIGLESKSRVLTLHLEPLTRLWHREWVYEWLVTHTETWIWWPWNYQLDIFPGQKHQWCQRSQSKWFHCRAFRSKEHGQRFSTHSTSHWPRVMSVAIVIKGHTDQPSSGLQHQLINVV